MVRYGLCDAGKLLVVPNGHEHVHRWAPAGAAAACTPDWRDTILMIGTPAPHKNVGLILGLSHRLQAVGLRIAIAGAAQEGVYQALDGQAYDQTAVTWLGNVTDAELAAILAPALSRIPVVRRGIRSTTARGHGARLSGGGFGPDQSSGDLRRRRALRLPR